jgi:hypothetical protein
LSSCPFFPESHINTNCALVCIQGQSNESLKAFFDFFSKHASVLTRLPNELFRLASNSRNIYIKGTLHEMQHKTEVYLEEWYQRIKDGTNAKDRDAKFSCLVRTLSLTEKNFKFSMASLAFEMEKLQKDDYQQMYTSLRYLRVLRKLYGMQQCGLLECVSFDAQENWLYLVRTIVQTLELVRGNMRENGFEFYEDATSSFLEQGSGNSGDSSYKFLELAGLWTNTESRGLLSLSIYVPPKVWEDDQKRFDLEKTLCQQVAQSARIHAQLVDILRVDLDHGSSQSGAHGKAFVSLMAQASGLRLTIKSGSFWPVFSDADSKYKGNIMVGIRVTPLRKKRVPKETSLQGQSRTLLARLAQKTQFVTKSRPGEIDPVMPVFEDESFELYVYAPDQCLVLTAYSVANGIQGNLGEIYIKVDDMLSECRRSNSTVTRTYGLANHLNFKPVYCKNKADKSDMKQAQITCQFTYFTRAAPCTPQQMVERVAKEASDLRSPLCEGCVVTGLGFEDDRTLWESLTVYVVAQSQTSEFMQEREILNRCVFPALFIRCQALKVHLSWINMSERGEGAVGDVVNRLLAMNRCKIKRHDEKGKSMNCPFVLCLLGEKHGRVLDAKDTKKLVDANHDGIFDWVSFVSHSTHISLYHIFHTTPSPLSLFDSKP